MARSLVKTQSVAEVCAALAIVTLAAGLVAGSDGSRAHHSYVSKYDSAKVIKLSGVVTSVSFTNPHIFFAVDVGGTTWTVETESITVARANGLSESVLKEGAKVTVSGWPSREKAAEMGLNTISFSGGPTITMRRTAR